MKSLLDQTYYRLLREFRRMHTLHAKPKGEWTRIEALFESYWRRRFYHQMDRLYGSQIGIGLELGENPVFIHQFHGIFIADRAKIGNNAVFYQHVTVGIKTYAHKPPEAPVIGNDVVLGAHTVLIGRCIIGDGAKIGAGVTLVDANIPPGAVIINKSAYDLTNKRPVYS
jgi:serine O-acetyltransferase